MQDDGLGQYETCSLCTTEVLWVSLRETQLGNICRDCYLEET